MKSTKRIKLLLLGMLTFCMSASANAIEVTRVTCEMDTSPLAISTTTPRFGWQLKGEQGCMQSAYEIEVYTRQGDKPTYVWRSGKQLSTKSQLITYSGIAALQPITRYWWRVRVWDEQGAVSAWSDEQEFRIAPDKSFLDAQWIGAVTQKNAKFPEGRRFHGGALSKAEAKEAWNQVDSMAWRSICLRKEFNTSRQIADATVYVCGLGQYELSINGTKVGDGEFTPLWSDYDKTVYYNTYDVTSLVHQGDNALGVTLGNGFYNVVGGGRYRKLQIGFGPETLFLKMLVRYTDGTSQTVATDSTWRYDRSPVTFHSIYGGEDYDARLEQAGWDKPGFDDTAWHQVVVQESPKGVLRPQLTTPVKIMKRYGVKSCYKLTPEEVRKATKATKRTVDASAQLLDMGQNLSGFPEITVSGKRGQRITLVVAETVVDSCHAANQRQTGRQHYYTYTLKGDKRETWHPRFSYYGFRYIQLEGAVLKGQKNPDKLPVVHNIQSCFVHNAAADVSSFSCSNKIFTQAHQLIHNAVRSNMQAVFTDCPHREKLGWLEQVHLNGPGLLYNYDLTTLFPKVMRDMADAQRTDGMVPTTAPQYTVFEGPGLDVFADSPEWGSSIVVIPFLYYDTYGDDSLIRQYYRQMRGYVDYLSSRAEDGLIDFGLGDWYDYGDFRAGFSRNTPIGLVASAHYYMDIRYIAEAARLLGNNYDADYYTRLGDEVTEAFNRKYFNEKTHQYGTGSQTSNALPLFLDMVPADAKAEVLRNLVKDIRQHGMRLTTGDVGNRYLFQTLARNGLHDVMYALHNHEEAPGYGFQLKFGATTLTEQWDPRQGSSWNHFMMGQIDEWFFHSLAGIQNSPTEKGYQHFVIQPKVAGDLTSLDVTYKTLYGEIAVHWQRTEDQFNLQVTVPVNCTADIWLPGDDQPVKRVKSGTYSFSKPLKLKGHIE